MGFIRRIMARRGLEGDEKKAVALVGREGMKQKELREKMGMNPVRFNKFMRGLEEKRIAKREPRGRENVVRLL